MSSVTYQPVDVEPPIVNRPSPTDPQTDEWALVLDVDADMVSYLARALMFFQPGFRVASAANVDAIVEWLETQKYEVVVEGCLGDAEAENKVDSLLAGVTRVKLACEHRVDGAALERPPRLSALLSVVQSFASGTIDLGSLPKG